MLAVETDAAGFGYLVRRAVRLVPDRAPVLRGVLISAEGDQAEIVVSDMTVTGRGLLGARVERPGRVLVWAEYLARIARHLPGPAVRIEQDGVHVVITSGPARWRLIAMPAEDYPSNLPEGKPLDGVRPAGPDAVERRLSHGAAVVRSIRAAWRTPRPTVRPYAPKELEPGAWITWHRRTGDGEHVTVTGQVWSAAPGQRAVWAVAEGEQPAYVQEHAYGTVKRLEETTPPDIDGPWKQQSPR